MLFPTDQQVFLVEDDAALRDATVQRLELAGIAVRAFASAVEALPRIDHGFAGAIVSDIRLPRIDGLELLDRVRGIDPDIPVILVTGHGDVPMAVGALQAGAFDFLTKPFAADQLVASIRRALEKRLLVIDNRRLRDAAQMAQAAAGPLIGDSRAMRDLRAAITRVAKADLDVLVEGETGTGKELVARLLHSEGPRRGRSFVAVNCGALPDALAEAELFGHTADAVPHTRLSRVGQIEGAHRGTLLLDEIDSMPLPLQIKLLRVLEEREVHPIGAERARPIDIKVIATTKRPLDEAVAAGSFREDLFYRLNVVRLRVPALRERVEDVPFLFAAFVAEARQQFHLPEWTMVEGIAHHLASHRWPGNVRELRHYAFRAVLDLGEPSRDIIGAAQPLAERVRQFEKALIEEALVAHNGRVSRTISSLAIPRKTFYDKVGRLNIDLARSRVADPRAGFRRNGAMPDASTETTISSIFPGTDQS